MRIFAFDLDGTLLNSENYVNEYTNEVLKKISDQGDKIVIATGRGLQKVKPILDRFSAIDYAVCSNGAVIYDVKKDSYEVLSTLDVKDLPFMFSIQDKYDLPLVIDSPQRDATTIKGDKGKFPDWAYGGNGVMENDLSIFSDRVETTEYFNKNSTEIVKYAFRMPQELTQEVYEQVVAATKNVVVYITNRVYVDVNPAGTSKYLGIRHIVDNFNLTLESLVAFGDSDNDLEMVQHAHVGVAMGNGTDNVKEVADIVIGHHNSDAIGKLLEAYIE